MKFLSLDNLKIELLHLSSTAFKPFLFLLMTKHFSGILLILKSISALMFLLQFTF